MTDPNEPAGADGAHDAPDHHEATEARDDDLLPPRGSERHHTGAPSQSDDGAATSAVGATGATGSGLDGDTDADLDDDNDNDADGEEPKKKAGCLKVGCLTLLSMALVAVLAVGGFAAYLNWKLDNNIQRSNMIPDSAGQPTRRAEAGDALNILLMGSDSRSTNLTDASRSDVIQLVHISDDRKSVQVIHFPRDLYVSIPGHGKNKINAAYAFGGEQLLILTLQNLLGIKIDHAAQIGFEGFAKLTDTVGGVDLYVSQPYSEGSFGTWDVGWHHMNGQQALGFVRERHQLKEGDIDRGRNQQAWIKAVMAKTLKAGTLLNPVKLNTIVDDLTADKNLRVDQDMPVQSLGFSLRNLRMGNVSFYTAPFTGFGSDPVAGSIDIVDEPKMKELGNAVATDDFSKYTGSANPLR